MLHACVDSQECSYLVCRGRAEPALSCRTARQKKKRVRSFRSSLDFAGYQPIRRSPEAVVESPRDGHLAFALQKLPGAIFAAAVAAWGGIRRSDTKFASGAVVRLGSCCPSNSGRPTSRRSRRRLIYQLPTTSRRPRRVEIARPRSQTLTILCRVMGEAHAKYLPVD